MTFEDLPHPRALIKRVSFRVMFKEAGQQERSSMQSFLSSIVRVILRECAISSQFKVGNDLIPRFALVQSKKLF